MKRIFMMLAMVAAVAVACDQASPETKFDLSETTLSLEAVSGEGSFTITSNEAWTAVANAAWLEVSPASGDASESAVTVTVTAQDNETGDMRDAVITITAGTLVKTVNVAQAAKAVAGVTEFAADFCEGFYYGDAYSLTTGEPTGTYNYLVILSDNGLADPSDYTSYNPNTTYYQLDIFSETPAEEGEYATVPNGTYQLDLESTYNASTLSAYSKLIVSGAEGGDDYEDVEFTEATAVVTDGKIVLTATLANGDRHEVTFEGALEIPVYGYGEEYEEWTSEDLELAVTDAAIEFFPDEEAEGYWWICATDPETEEKAMLYICQNVDAEDIVGEFNAKSAEADGVGFVAGNKEYDGSIWIGYPGAPLADGKITITKEGEVYTITFNCTDGEDHAITGSISGIVPVYEEE